MQSLLSLAYFALLCFQTHSLQWTGVRRPGKSPRGGLSDLARPSAPNGGLPLGAEPVGMYERKTQSPMVWLNLEKVLPDAALSWHHVSYQEEAEQRLGMLQDLVA